MSKYSKTIVMFDMDGTLTEPRQKFNASLLGEDLYTLTNKGISIGIITGSDINYLNEQMGSFISSSSCRYKIHLLPCNGTKYLEPPLHATETHKMIHNVSMRKHLGDKNYRDLICELIYSQVDLCHIGAPLTGHFINCRGSMINWSPIGRNASSSERQMFIDLDNEKGVRENVLSELNAMLELKKLKNKITIKLGGDTSFDIYPTGWDKRYGLRHFEDWDVWFVGDRCGENGNDFEIYKECNDQSYKTSGPIQTKEIILDIIKRIG